jgi:hypothetical protein
MNYRVKRYFKKLDPCFKEVFKHKKDPFATLASMIFEVPYEECNPFEFYDNKKIRQCRFPTAEGQMRRLFVKKLVVMALYPKRTELKQTIKDCKRLIVLNKE